MAGIVLTGAAWKDCVSMSFSSEVKEELEKVVPDSRHCQLAELAAIIHFGCRIDRAEEGKRKITLLSENLFVSRKYFT